MRRNSWWIDRYVFPVSVMFCRLGQVKEKLRVNKDKTLDIYKMSNLVNQLNCSNDHNGLLSHGL